MSFFDQDMVIRNHLIAPKPSFLNCAPTSSEEKSIRELIGKVAALDFSTSEKPKSIYVIEESAELIQEISRFITRLTKGERQLIPHAELVDEACDVLTTIFILLRAYDVSEEYVRNRIAYKCERTINRYKNGKEG